MLAAPFAAAQGGSTLTPLGLDSMSAFMASGANWRLASAVESNRTQRWSLSATDGRGILVNRPVDGALDNLFTKMLHGDLELELEFMLPKGSNSGIYLQGRYEVQLLDSWGKPNPSFSDAGGIYQRWDEIAGYGYEGHPPRVNASRAPGLWQSLHVVFRSPRFDASGRKVRHARFELVTLNGAVLHQYVEVTGPTRAAAFDNEIALGPLMIQGDHGPVAIRNIRYKHYGTTPIETFDVDYRMFVGDYTEIPAMESPTEKGRVDHLSEHKIDEAKPLLIEYNGTIQLTGTGTHRFSVALDWISGDPHFRDKRIGGAVLTIGEEEILRHDTNATTVERVVELEIGMHPFTFVFHKSAGWRPPGVTLLVEGPNTPARALMEAPMRGQRPGLVTVAVVIEPTILRGFVQHGDAKRTHAVSVGDLTGVHYVLDLASAAMLYAWRGPFVDAAAMWHNRGHDQLARPQGSVLSLPGHPPITVPSATDSLRTLGYRLDAQQRPVFRYALGDIEIEDRLTPAENGPYLWRTLSFRTDHVPPDSLWVRAAEGSSIKMIQEGAYDIDDRSYYIELFGPAEVLRTDAGDALMLPVHFEDNTASVSYSLVW